MAFETRCIVEILGTFIQEHRENYKGIFESKENTKRPLTMLQNTILLKTADCFQMLLVHLPRTS